MCFLSINPVLLQHQKQLTSLLNSYLQQNTQGILKCIAAFAAPYICSQSDQMRAKMGGAGLFLQWVLTTERQE